MNYWLIEDEHQAWFSVCDEQETWRHDASVAVRFADERSARDVIRLLALTATATEHEDVPPTERDEHAKAD